MKKRLLAIVCLIMTLIMGLACVSGCRLVTTDGDKDMQQVVAEVSIENGVKDKIYKQDLIIAYLNYGYVYVESYGYTQEQTFNLLIDGLINNRILIQNAMKEMSAEYNTTGSDVYKVEKYLTEDEVIEAKYGAIYSVNQLIEQFGEDAHAGHSHATSNKDTVPGTVRVTPTGATVSEEEVTDADKKEYVEKYEKQGITSAIDSTDVDEIVANREAFNKAVNMLKINNLLGNYDGKDLATTEYFKTILNQQYESVLINKFRSTKQSAIREKVDFADLEQEYLKMVDEQSSWNNADFVEALSSSSINKPVLFGVNGTYGYVYNILLGASELQTTKIKAIDKDLSIAEKEDARRQILEGTTVVDLRDSWITAGYDYDQASNKFTGDYTFAKDAANSLAFQGAVRLADGSYDDNKAYSATAKTMSLAEFVDMMEEYVYGNATLDYSQVASAGSYYKGAKFDGEVVEYKAKMQELLFAFSTDSGSLNNENGYLIKPPVDGADNEEYVLTFAEAGRKLLAMGGNSYIIVASDYGYHVMFFSEVYSVGTAVANNLTEYLNDRYVLDSNYTTWQEYYDAMMADWDEWEETDNFLYVLQDGLTSAKITNEINVYEKNVSNTYMYEKDGCVVKYEKAYEDLLGK